MFDDLLAPIGHKRPNTLYFCVKKSLFFDIPVKCVVYFTVVTEGELTVVGSGGLMHALDNL
ncbi:hypothetical protein HUX88_05415 [Duganella sp. BJB1802]|uniref:hypothetical protein n=1 Tax=unclassified Duganella TaxID=2636909 RepID=UPI0011C0DDAC|nr:MULTISPECIES: hypothetical protein [unclassified Duganella]NVD69993.1 hypothetical protein [Duganella sp. BJB1802]